MQCLLLEMIYEGRDIFVWLSTGYEKSLCHELETILFLMDYKFELKVSSKRSEVLHTALSLSLSPSLSLSVQPLQIVCHTYDDD